MIKIISDKKCVIGEGPVWNERENCLYYTNGGGKEYCKYSFQYDTLTTVPSEKDCAAFVFDKNNNIIVSRYDGVFLLNKDGSAECIYDKEKYCIKYANDMKAGPDGRIYVGTQSEKKIGISEKTNGKLYSIDKHGNVKILLENLLLSNGMDWSNDEKFFYHTDSGTGIIREYEFHKDSGEIVFTNRQIAIPGVDGFTISRDNKLYVACWGQAHIAVADIKTMKIEKYIDLPCKTPTSCAFCGANMDLLAITTASCDSDPKTDINGGCTLLLKTCTEGRKPYLFG